jgi:NAD(P)-dependent dehydrogenase (short-subunit alcohol dehydrogenase family)
LSACSYLLIGLEGIENADIEQRLKRNGHRAIRESNVGAGEPIDGVVLQTQGPALGTAFLDVSDNDMRDALARFVGVIGSLQQALQRIRPGGSIVVVTSRGYLGARGGAQEMAFSAAIVALIRSVALECMSRRVRANVIAVEFKREPQERRTPGESPGPSDAPGSVADIAAFLLSEESGLINGYVLLADNGRSLQMREARDPHRR